jgi:nitroreductase
MDLTEAIRTKRAVRQFSDQPIPIADLLAILNAGRRAQSSKNTQPWQFIAITNKETLSKLSTLGQYAGHLAGAAAAIAILTPDPGQRWSIMFDAGQAAAYMQLEAWGRGIGSVPATIYEPEAARQVLGAPPEWHVNVIFSFGYPANPDDLSRPPKKGGRIALDEVIHWEKW